MWRNLLYVQVWGQVVFLLEQSWLFYGVLLVELSTPNHSFTLCVLLWYFVIFFLDMNSFGVT